MTQLSRYDRLRFRLSRLVRRAGDHLPELGLGGLVTAAEVLLFVQELVTAPSPWLAALFALPLPVAAFWVTRAVRRHKKSLTLPSSARVPFPDRIDGLVGRDAELSLVKERARERGVVVVRGAMGMGTSAVAIRAMWELADTASKQRYADLRGPDRDHPETPLSVAQRVLRTLNRPPGAVQQPEDATPQVIEALTGTGCVLLIDNVSTWSQVSWLPPRVPGAHIVVAGTLADGPPQHSEPIQLGPLDPAAGRELLARHVGDERVNRDPKALELLVDACLSSPLELVRIGRWLARNPKVPLQALVDDLRSLPMDKTLDFLLNLSVKQLRPTAKQLFALLARLPIAEVDHLAAAALLGIPSAEDAIAELTELGLVESVRMRRVRVIGAFRGGGPTGSPREGAAWRRLVEHFALQAGAYAALLPAGQARTWFAIEDRALLQVLGHPWPAPKTGRALGRIADGLETWFRLEQRHEDRLRAAEALARAAEELGDRRVRATAELRQCAILLTWGNPRQARRHFTQAAELWGDRTLWPAEMHLEHAAILLAEGDEFTDVESALVHYGQKLGGGDVAGRALRMANAAALLMRKGQTLDHDGRGLEARRLYADARVVLFESLELASRAGDRGARAHAHELLALAHRYLRAPFDANYHLEQAEHLYDESTDEIGRARCLVQRAGALLESDDRDDHDTAVTLLERAEPRLPPTGVSTALAHLHLARLRRERVTEHREAGLAALALWDGIAEPKQVSELRAYLLAL